LEDLMTDPIQVATSLAALAKELPELLQDEGRLMQLDDPEDDDYPALLRELARTASAMRQTTSFCLDHVWSLSEAEGDSFDRATTALEQARDALDKVYGDLQVAADYTQHGQELAAGIDRVADFREDLLRRRTGNEANEAG
jgi:hypothetical protein